MSVPAARSRYVYHRGFKVLISCSCVKTKPNADFFTESKPQSFSPAGETSTDQHQNQHQNTTYAVLLVTRPQQDQHMLCLGAGFGAGLCWFFQQDPQENWVV